MTLCSVRKQFASNRLGRPPRGGGVGLSKSILDLSGLSMKKSGGKICFFHKCAKLVFPHPSVTRENDKHGKIYLFLLGLFCQI